jgi:hypothetical protein
MTSFLSWKRTLDKLKVDARKQTDENPTPSDAAIAIVEEALHKSPDERMSSLRAAARAGVDVALKPAPGCTVYGWLLFLSRTRTPEGQYLWHLSASLSPKGRGSNERDWEVLGKIAAHLGSPREPIVVPDNPNDVHHWNWFESN